MKFSNGCWLNREGFETHSPAEVSRITPTETGFTLLTPCQNIRHRGDTLAGPNLEIRFSSPMNDVLKIRIDHFKGQKKKGPDFEVTPDKAGQIKMKEEEKSLLFQTGNLTAKVDKEAWNVEFRYKERYLTSTGWRNMAYISEGQKKDYMETLPSYMRDQLGLSVGEYVYGLGERFTPFIKNGQVVNTWNEDGGTATDYSYKNIPFYLTNKGYGVFVNQPEEVSFEVGSEKVTRVQFSVPGESLEYYIIGGESLKEVLNNYTKLTGKAAMPPAWSFGLWLTTSFTTDYDEETVNHFTGGMKERDIPLDVFHFDCFWMREFNWCDFAWDKRVFPDPEGMLKRLHDKGFHISAWINPYIGQASPLFQEGLKGNYFIKRPKGDVWQWDLWQPGMAIVDFTNPEAWKWFQSKLAPLAEMGVDSFKTDFGERIPTDVVYFDGSDPMKMHNYYTYLYNQCVFEILEEKTGKDKAVLFARSATVGGQKFPIHWGGDCTSEFVSMAESLRGGLSLGLSGFSFWSHDMGGFENTSTADVYKRWTAFGLLSSHSRLHGSSSYRVPWLYDEEAVDVVRFFSKLKCRLMPYIFSTACEAVDAGLPMMRPTLLEFEDDLTAQYLDRQYLLGESLLVAPVLNEEGRESWYLPEGKWTHFLSGEVKEGGKFYTDSFDYFSLPLFVRPNSFIAMGETDDKAQYDYSEGLSLHFFEPLEGEEATFTVYTERHQPTATIQSSWEGDTMKISVDSKKGCTLVLRNKTQCTMISGDAPEKTDQGLAFNLPEGKQELLLQF